MHAYHWIADRPWLDRRSRHSQVLVHQIVLRVDGLDSACVDRVQLRLIRHNRRTPHLVLNPSNPLLGETLTYAKDSSNFEAKYGL